MNTKKFIIAGGIVADNLNKRLAFLNIMCIFIAITIWIEVRC